MSDVRDSVEPTSEDRDASSEDEERDARDDDDGPATPGAGVPESAWQTWRAPLLLIVLTFVTTLYAGASMHGLVREESASSFEGVLQFFRWLGRPRDVVAGWDFAFPLMGILLAHEFGHYIAGRVHRVDISPPYFIPMPMTLLGTMGAVIRMRGAIRDRNALLDVGAAGPLAGMVVALPVLIFGIASSPIQPLPAVGSFIIEGRSILYLTLLWLLKGPIPEGHDIMLTPTALAGWAGLLVTMMNLLPFGQLDGGHVAYALLGSRQNRIARGVLYALPVVSIVTGLAYGIPAMLRGAEGDALISEAAAGMHWMVWFGVLLVMTRFAGRDHPPAGGAALTAGRRAIAVGTLVLFVLLFMPSWIRLG